MFDTLGTIENIWTLSSLSDDDINRLCMEHLMSDKSDMDFLAIIGKFS